jgi:hypothetical protein
VFFPQIFLFLLYRELTQKMGRKNIPRTKSDLDLVRSPGRLADCIFPLIFSFYPGAEEAKRCGGGVFVVSSGCMSCWP